MAEITGSASERFEALLSKKAPSLKALELPTEKRVALYARASTTRQVSSVEDQLKLLREHCKSKGYNIVAEHSDVASGRLVNNRRGYADLWDCIKKQECDIVLVHDFSRLGRKTRNVLKFVEFVEQNRVVLESATTGPLTRLHALALGMVAEIQLDVSTEQIKRALVSNVLDGLRAGARIYGYRSVVVNGEKGHLEEIPEEAAVVKRIYRMADEDNLGPSAICRILNFGPNPVPAPMGGKWRAYILSHHKGRSGMLHNSVYKGCVTYNKMQTKRDVETEKSSHELRDESEWYERPGQHKPIIDPDQFDRVQEKFRRRIRHTPRRVSGPKTLFSGRIKCPFCLKVNEDGTTMYGTMGTVGGSRVRIQCTGYPNGYCNSAKSYYRDEVQRVVLDGLLQTLREPEAIQKFLEERALEARSTAKEKKKDLARIAGLIAKLDREIVNLTLAIAKGGDARRLNVAIEQRQSAKIQAEFDLEALATDTTEFQLDPPSVSKYLELIETVTSKLQKSPTEAIDVELAEKIELLVDRILVHPLKGQRAFEVEVFGKLAHIVKGTESFRSIFCQGSGVKQLLDSRTLTKPRAAADLKLLFFKAQFRRDYAYHRMMDVLRDDAEPVCVETIIERLSQRGINYADTALAHLALRSKGQIIRVRKNGYMLRANHDKLALRWFTRKAHVVTLAQEVLRGKESMSLAAILREFERRGFAIYGNSVRSLGKIFSDQRTIFRKISHSYWALR